MTFLVTWIVAIMVQIPCPGFDYEQNKFGDSNLVFSCAAFHFKYVYEEKSNIFFSSTSAMEFISDMQKLCYSCSQIKLSATIKNDND